MQERQVTVEGQTFPLEAPFHVLATANPVEYEGTYPLPEAQLDRFLMRVVASATRPATRSGTCSAAGSPGGRRSRPSTPVTDAAGLLRDAGRDRDGHGRGERRPLLRRARRRPPASTRRC